VTVNGGSEVEIRRRFKDKFRRHRRKSRPKKKFFTNLDISSTKKDFASSKKSGNYYRKSVDNYTIKLLKNNACFLRAESFNIRLYNNLFNGALPLVVNSTRYKKVQIRRFLRRKGYDWQKIVLAFKVFKRRIGIAFLLFFPVLAQDEDPNPDSPTPVLLSEPDSTRAMTQAARLKTRRGKQLRFPNEAFALGSEMRRFYVSNVELLKDEGAGSFRVYIEDSKGQKIPFPGFGSAFGSGIRRRLRADRSNSLTRSVFARLSGRLAATITLFDVPAANWFYKEALYGDAQLRHRVAWALSQIWVVSGVDTQQSSWMIAVPSAALSRNAFGNWRTLMQEMTLNPAMGNYLDMAIDAHKPERKLRARDFAAFQRSGCSCSIRTAPAARRRRQSDSDLHAGRRSIILRRSLPAGRSAK
jgi:hypothetical protein